MGCTIATPHEGVSGGFYSLFRKVATMFGRTAGELLAGQDQMIERLAQPPYTDALQSCTRVVIIGSLNEDREIPPNSALAASHGVCASSPCRGSQDPISLNIPGIRRVAPVMVNDGMWSRLEALSNVERYAIVWRRCKLSAHDEAAAHYGPFHFI